jgi:hypothetical protein
LISTYFDRKFAEELSKHSAARPCRGDRRMGSLLFPGGTAVTHLAVYDWTGPDGRPGGAAHTHLVCTEGYVVLGGSGRLQTLGAQGFEETRLTPLTVAWFSPGVIHRLVNDGDLRIAVVMQNSGLPEAGDSVLTFPPEHLTDAETYRSAAALPEPTVDIHPTLTGATAEAGVESAARRRAELAVAGFLQLRQRFATHGASALDEFYTAAAALIRPRLDHWRDTWRQGAWEAARRTGEQLDALSAGSHAYLYESAVSVLPPPPERDYGMCGRLATYPIKGE